ncbi:MAG: NlpC/P60 family protein [Pseudomonadota bacterium]
MNRVVAAARHWIGTPYMHQASCRGAGCDCLGLVRGVWRDCLGSEPAAVPPYSRDWSEPSGEERLWHAALTHLISRPIHAAKPGDVLLFRMKSGTVAKHLAIQSEIGSHPQLIHSYARHGVVESALSTPWARRLVARFAFPERT